MVYDIDPENINLKTSQDHLREKQAEIIKAVSSFDGGESLDIMNPQNETTQQP